ncbi:hypothetical protein [Amycolatopsis kentuckyensis]|uniref:hypothetical protein n=1 Tax=Amycolatopsis kentuckyensis TaxID=218823 RepID=UPI000A387D1E|nr:hypothetical protein [Amycolatopsis kentuckyensis]
MMSKVRTMAMGVAAAAALTCALAASPAAQASTALSAPTTTCGGAGWTLIDHQDLISPFGENYGVVTLYYGNGYNCAATTKRVAVGVLTNASTFVCRKNDGKCLIKSGDATNRVWTGALYAPTTCVKWGGGVDDVDGSRVYVEVGWSHGNDC